MSGFYTQAVFGDDATSDGGARRLKAYIERYWAERGYTVEVHLKRLPYSGVARVAAFAVTSDMINGLPREAFHKQREQTA